MNIMSADSAQLYHLQCDGWLHTALFSKDRVSAIAAESNLRRALRDHEGVDAALIAIGESPCLVQSQLPRLWLARRAAIASRRAAGHAAS